MRRGKSTRSVPSRKLATLPWRKSAVCSLRNSPGWRRAPQFASTCIPWQPPMFVRSCAKRQGFGAEVMRLSIRSDLPQWLLRALIRGRRGSAVSHPPLAEPVSHGMLPCRLCGVPFCVSGHRAADGKCSPQIVGGVFATSSATPLMRAFHEPRPRTPLKPQDEEDAALSQCAPRKVDSENTA